jgi:hypothetical protein
LVQSAATTCPWSRIQWKAPRDLDSIVCVGHDPDDPRRPLSQPARRRSDTEPGTPRAIAEGSGVHDRAAREARAMVAAQMRRGTAVAFGGQILRIERHEGSVAIVLPDGTLLIGDDHQASVLADVLTDDDELGS